MGVTVRRWSHSGQSKDLSDQADLKAYGAAVEFRILAGSGLSFYEVTVEPSSYKRLAMLMAECDPKAALAAFGPAISKAAKSLNR